MNIQSNSPENIYSRLRKILFNNKIINTINISLIIGSYFVFDAFAVLWFYIGGMVILALISEGEILDKAECRARFSFFIILISIFIDNSILFFKSPIAKPIVVRINSNGLAHCSFF